MKGTLTPTSCLLECRNHKKKMPDLNKCLHERVGEEIWAWWNQRSPLMFSSKVPFIIVTPSCTSGNQTNARTSSSESPPLPAAKRGPVKNVHLLCAAMGGAIIDGSGCEWLSSLVSAVAHIQPRPLTCERAWGRCMANMVMYICGGIKHITTPVMLTGKDQDQQRYQTLHPSACRTGRNDCVASTKTGTQTWNTQKGTSGGSCHPVLLLPVVFIRFLLVLSFILSRLVWSLDRPSLPPLLCHVAFLVFSNVARALPALDPVQLCHVINLHFCVSWMRLRRIMLWTWVAGGQKLL